MKPSESNGILDLGYLLDEARETCSCPRDPGRFHPSVPQKTAAAVCFPVGDRAVQYLH